MIDQVLTKLNACQRMLVECQTAEQAKHISDVAEAARIYAKRVGAGIEVTNRAAEYKFRAERRLGEILRPSPKNKGGRPRKTGSTREPVNGATLKEIGITKKTSARAQKLAGIKLKQFESMLSQMKEEGKDITVSGFTRPVGFSSATDQHNTPKEIVNAVIKCLGSIDLDPCSNNGKPNVPAKKHLRVKDDGLLAQGWLGKVYMNPPYGNVIVAWVEKLKREYESGCTTEGIALVPARTDTEWFTLLSDYPCCFIRGRLVFGGNENSAPFPSAAFYLGKNLPAFKKAFGDFGGIWKKIDA